MTSGTWRQYRIPAASPAQMAPPTAPASSARPSTIQPGPGTRTAVYAQRSDAPMRSWPSWPMFTSPALVAMIVPTATISRGAAVVNVSPQAPGERTLPSRSAENTLRGDPPVAHTRRAQRARATVTEAT